MATTTLWHESASFDEMDGNLLTFARRQGLQALNGLDRTTLMGFLGTTVSNLLSDSLALSVIESNAVAVREKAAGGAVEVMRSRRCVCAEHVLRCNWSRGSW